MKINKHIEIVSSSTNLLSSMGRVSREAASAVLSKHYTNVRVTLINKPGDLKALATRNPDLVFLNMKFVPIDDALGVDDPDKVWLSQYLDKHKIAYTGSSQKSHELEYNKPLAKQLALNLGLKTSPFYVVKRNQLVVKDRLRLTFPLFIKPTNRGGGLGIDEDSVANNFEQLQSKVRSISSIVRSDSLVEEYLPGREFSVAVLKNEYSAGYFAMPIEKIPPLDRRGNRLLSKQIKSADSVCDAKVTDKILKARLEALALSVYSALRARDYGRIDIRLDKFGVPHFLEANLLPSLIEGYGSFPKASVLNMNLGYEDMILRIVKLGLSRSGTNKTIPKPVTTGSAMLPSFQTIPEPV